MKQSEAVAIENAIEEFDGAVWVQGEGIAAMRRTPKYIRFTPKIELGHDGQPMNAHDLRRALAAHLRRVAEYLEL